MANVVDALLVTLGLDTKDYEKGTKKAEKSLNEFSKKQETAKKKNAETDNKTSKERDKQQKVQREQEKSTIDGLNKIRNQMIGVMGVFMAGQGIMNFAKSAIYGAAAIGRLADNTGMSVKEVAGLGQALERIGGTTEEAQGAISGLAGELSKYKLGMESTITEYIRWNGGIQHGELDTTANLMLGMADSFERMNKANPADAMLKAGRMGISANMFNLLKQGREAVKAQIADGANLTGINRKQTDEAEKAQKAWVDMAAHLASVGRAVLFPILQAISDWMGKHKADIHVWLDKLRDGIANFSPKAIEGIGKTFDRIYETVEKIVSALEMMGKLADRFGLSGGGEKKKPANTNIPGAGLIGNMYATGLMSMVQSMQGLFGMKSNSSSTSVHVGQINVTGANDPKGSGKAVESALQNFSGLAAQANSGQR